MRQCENVKPVKIKPVGKSEGESCKSLFTGYISNVLFSVSWKTQFPKSGLIVPSSYLPGRNFSVCSSLHLHAKNTKKYNLTSLCLLPESSQLFYFISDNVIQVSEICHFLSLTNRAHSHQLVLYYGILNV